MCHPSRQLHHLAAVAATTMFLLWASASVALAGPAPIEPEYAPAEPQNSTGGFDWMLAGAAVLATIAVVGVIAVLWHRAHATGRRLATP